MPFKIEDVKSEVKPIISQLISRQPLLWINPLKALCNDYPTDWGFPQEEIHAASLRFQRFAPFIEMCFEETRRSGGIIESPLANVNHMSKIFSQHIPIQLMVKLDSHLPISGSIKARGGIHEVLCHAEALALKAELIKPTDSYSAFASPEVQRFLNGYTIQVGSTGNLGLSIGIMSAALGFKVVVHMSSDAKQWKKDMLRSKGVTVIEYEEDYGVAVERGRALSDLDPMSYFVDDEHSTRLFSGYAVAGERLKEQLEEMAIEIGKDKKLFVYLPCGVGGGPGGVAHGIKRQYLDNAHVFFAEPIESPCMLLSMATESLDSFSVQDIGLSNQTLADGLAVGRASALVAQVMSQQLDGIATVKDETLLEWLNLIWQYENIKLEPSALAGLAPFTMLKEKLEAGEVISHITLEDFYKGVHIIWATGGSMVPQTDFNNWLEG